MTTMHPNSDTENREGRSVPPVKADTAVDPPVVRRRHYGRAVTSLILLAAAAGLLIAFANAKINYAVTLEFLFDGTVLQGAINTLVMSVLAMIIGLILGTASAIASMSKSPVLRTVSSIYTWLFRGTPVLVQLLLWYNLALVFPTMTIPGLGTYLTTSLITPFVAALVGLGLNEGAYMSEIVRGGLLAVGHGQRQAAEALGMSPFVAMRVVILPQAFRVALPGTGNQFVIMLKSSAMASVIQYGEVLYASQTIYQRNFAIIELLLVASFWYIVLTTVFTFIQGRVERRLGRSALISHSASQARPSWWARRNND